MGSFRENTVTGEDDLTRDAFLGGQLQLWQPVRGYRAGVDPILLAASVPAVSGQSVLELGCGAGAAMLALATRVPGVQVTGVELQAEYADLARRNAAANGIPAQVETCDLSQLPDGVRQRRFDHVIANPPYYRSGAHSLAEDPGRQIALAEATPLADWISVASRRLAPKGILHMIHRAGRLPDMLTACSDHLGSVEVLPLVPRTGRMAELVILRARKGGRADFRLHSPLVLHEGDRHLRDGDSYRDEISAILRQGAALVWP